MSRQRTTSSATLIVSVAVSLVMLAGVNAQPASGPARPAKVAVDNGGPAWSSLSPQQRSALAPLERDWAGIDSTGKAKWMEIASRYPSLPADERRRMQQRMTEWARMTPTERGQARMSFQEAKQLSPKQRQARWEAYQALTDDERKALASRAQPKTDKPKPGANAALVAVPKQNLAASAPSGRPVGKPVAPSVVQAKPGATTTLITKSPKPPAHQQPGQPKIVATPNQVNRSTLLPKGGPQAAIASQAVAPTPQQP